jgi:hypothetical protein
MFIIGYRAKTTGVLVFSAKPVEHECYDKAKAEAERLAGLTVGLEYVVLEGKSASVTAHPPVVTRSI